MCTINEAIPLYLDYCKNGKGLSTDSIKAYELDLQLFETFLDQECGFFGTGTDLQDIDKNQLKAYLAAMNGQYKVKTIKRKLACLKGFFSYLDEECLIDESPMDKLKVHLKEPYTLPRVMTLNEIRKVLITAYNYPTGAGRHAKVSVLELLHLRDIAILETLFATGLRVHELCNLTKGDFNPRTNVITVVGKGQKERKIYLCNPEVLSALKKYANYKSSMGFNSEYIFLNKQGSKLSCQAVRDLVKKYTAAAGIDKRITPYAFRHSFASLLLEEGVDIKYIQDFLGHSSITTTQIYLHISEQSARKVMMTKHPRERLNKHIV